MKYAEHVIGDCINAVPFEFSFYHHGMHKAACRHKSYVQFVSDLYQ